MRNKWLETKLFTSCYSNIFLISCRSLTKWIQAWMSRLKTYFYVVLLNSCFWYNALTSWLIRSLMIKPRSGVKISKSLYFKLYSYLWLFFQNMDNNLKLLSENIHFRCLLSLTSLLWLDELTNLTLTEDHPSEIECL